MRKQVQQFGAVEVEVENRGGPFGVLALAGLAIVFVGVVGREAAG